MMAEVRLVVCAVCLVGCGFELQIDTAVDGPGVDAPGADADLTPRMRTFREGLDGYAGTLDSYLSDNVPGPHGAAPVLIWDLIPDEEHALLQFSSLFGPGPTQIPPGSTIVSASLRLVVVDPTTSVGTVREVVVPWDEVTTWATFGTAAGVQDADVGATVSAAPIAGTSLLDVTASVARWSANPATSFGWLFSPGGSDGCDVASSEASSAENRPTLVVTYIAP